MVRVTAAPPGLALSPFDPAYLQALNDVAYLLSIHPHINYQPQIDDLYARLAAIKIPPPYIPPPPEPFLRIEPISLDFAGTPIGVTSQKAFTLVNYGDGDGAYDLQNDAAAFDFTVLGSSKGTIKASRRFISTLLLRRPRHMRLRSAGPSRSTMT